MVGGDEVLVGGFGGFGGGDRGRDQDAVAKGGAGIGSEREIQFFLAIAENFLAKRIGGEKAVAAGVPIGGKAGIGGGVAEGGSGRVAARRDPWISAAGPRGPR